LVEEINRRVFFWPGDADGPTVASGKAHFARYANAESIAVLRVPFDELREACKPLTLQFSRINSGAALSRTKNKRGNDTFLSAGAFKGTPSDVVEIVVRDGVSLPPGTMMRLGLTGAWRPFFGLAGC
jgi:hypothetical protein